MTTADPATGEVVDEEPTLALVPLNLAEIDADVLVSMMPSPTQCAVALLIARERISNAPGALERLAGDVAAAKRALTVATGKQYMHWRREGAVIADARALTSISDEVQEATERLDEATLALEYARELKRTLTTDIDILRSLNANYRQEHR